MKDACALMEQQKTAEQTRESVFQEHRCVFILFGENVREQLALFMKTAMEKIMIVMAVLMKV